MSAIRLLAIVVFAFASCGPAAAAGKVALVIGNSSYENVSRLPNPRNDASDISKSLERLGFDVTMAQDLDFSSMRRALGRFSQKAVGSDMALVFFAGHGMEVNKQNYLIPTDAELKTDVAISYEAIPLELVTEAVSGAKGLKLVMLDACRNNPFAAQMELTNPSRSIGRGLARVEPVSGTLVSFAAKEGTVASDGGGRNSPYTKALLAHLEQPGVEINFLFRRVRDAVMDATANTQQPFTYGSLPGAEIYFKLPEAGEADVRGDNERLSKLEQELERLRRELLETRDGNAGDAKGDDNATPPKQQVLTAAQMTTRGVEAARRKDYAEAVKWYEKAADQGNADAQANLARKYMMGQGVKQDYNKALELYNTALRNNQKSAATDLAFMHINGKGVKKDYKRAEELLQVGLEAEIGRAATQYNLVFLYARGGHGLTADIDKAADLAISVVEAGEERVIKVFLDQFKGYPAAFRSAFQRKLKAKGYYAGAIDGQLGPKLNVAMRKFVKDS